VTGIPAREAGIDDEVGAIRAGLRADLVVVNGDQNDPLRAIIAAGPDDIQLVMIEGVALYGDRNVMERFWPRTSLENIVLPKGLKALASGSAGFVFSDVVNRLVPALAAAGTSLAPLTEGTATKAKNP
jgi:hypothetical protein